MSDDLLTPGDARVDELKRAIEAIVLVAHDPVPLDLLAQLLEQPTASIDRWCAELAAGGRLRETKR